MKGNIYYLEYNKSTKSFINRFIAQQECHYYTANQPLVITKDFTGSLDCNFEEMIVANPGYTYINCTLEQMKVVCFNVLLGDTNILFVKQKSKKKS